MTQRNLSPARVAALLRGERFKFYHVTSYGENAEDTEGVKKQEGYVVFSNDMTQISVKESKSAAQSEPYTIVDRTYRKEIDNYEFKTRDAAQKDWHFKFINNTKTITLSDGEFVLKKNFTLECAEYGALVAKKLVFRNIKDVNEVKRSTQSSLTFDGDLTTALFKDDSRETSERWRVMDFSFYTDEKNQMYLFRFRSVLTGKTIERYILKDLSVTYDPDKKEYYSK